MATILGTDADDELYGLAENDLIKGLGGADMLFGAGGNDEILGGEGNDTIYGEDGADVLSGEGGNDYLDGGMGNDTLRGGGGIDTMDGGIGADSMTGAASGDIYYVDSLLDLVIERSDHAGRDVVNAEIAYTLAENVEDLNILGGSNTSGNGNALDNRIVGNSANNRLEGRDGNDLLKGGEGNDILVGGVGNDRMEGGIGFDTYYVESVGDLVVDVDAGQIFSTVSFDLRDTPTIANVTLEGAGNADVRGNGLANVLSGNDGINVLNGSAGNDDLTGGVGDTLLGGANNDQLRGNECLAYGGRGNDTYFLRSDFTSQIAFELVGEGNDVLNILSNRNAADVIQLPDNFEDIRINLEYETADVYGSSRGERIEYWGGGRLFGGDGSDRLIHSRDDSRISPDLIIDGGGGNDKLYGHAGTADTLIGGAGTDSFYLNVGTKHDTVVDFQDGVEQLFLRAADFNLAAGALSAANFRAGTAAADADDRVIYDASTGSLFYDSDGNGLAAQVRFAVITAPLAVITHEDFQVAVF